MNTLADPNAARAHARAMGGTVVEAMPVLPPRADDLPAGIGPDDLLWEETIAAGGYATRILRRGTRLRLIDLQGDACASLLLFNAAMPTERLNIADTVKVQWNAYPGAGSLLLSDMGRAMASMETDEAVVLRGDDAGSCSQVQLSVDGALYSVVASKRRGADQSVHAGGFDSIN